MGQQEAPRISAPESDDADLVRRARNREEAAIRAIMQANNRRLYRIARGILRNDSEAEDVVQAAYVRAFTHLDEFRGRVGAGILAGADNDERGARTASATTSDRGMDNAAARSS